MQALDASFGSGSRPAEEVGPYLDLAMLAHDIRGALQGVIGGIAAIDANRLPADVQEQLSRISTAAGSIESLTGLLGSEARDSAQGTVALRTFLTYFEGRWAGEAHVKGLELQVLAAPGIPQEIRVGHLALARVLGNLVHNSIRYGDTGVIELRVTPGNAGGVAFRLTDEGPGIPPEVLDGAFGPTPLTQIKPMANGHGLGLHIVRSIGREIGAEVSVRNRTDRSGVEAVLHVPEALCGAVPKPAVPADGRPDLGGVRILLAEDNATNRMVATQMLTMLGAKVEVACDGVDAMELFEAGAFDLVVVDIEMPRMTGLDVIRAVRALGGARGRTPIVALTAYVLKEHRERISEAGANGLISKPIASVEALGLELVPHLHHRHEPKANGQPKDDTRETMIETTDVSPEGAVDMTVYDALAATIGSEMMSELLEKVEADLGQSRRELCEALDPLALDPIRSASHILISVAGAFGATRLQSCARELNNRAQDEASADVAGLVKRCIGEIDAAVAFTSARRAGEA